MLESSPLRAEGRSTSERTQRGTRLAQERRGHWREARDHGHMRMGAAEWRGTAMASDNDDEQGEREGERARE